MNTQRLARIILTIGTCIALFSCNETKKQFTVSGTINDADSLVLYLEKRGLTETVIIDSAKLDKEGKYSFKQEALEYPEFFRLKLAEQVINFSVDSIESIQINSGKTEFASKYTVVGSESSSSIKEIIIRQAELNNTLKQINRALESQMMTPELRTKYIDEMVVAIDSYKKFASKLILDEGRTPAAYFALFQRVDDLLIFSPTDKKDLNLFRTVATVWDNFYIESPRAPHLKKFTLTAIANMRKLEEQKELAKNFDIKKLAKESDFFAISLPDIHNKMIDTKSFKGKHLVLDFTAYQSDFSLTHNVKLNQIYSKNNSKIEIYQVSFDNDKHQWQNIAVNLPWICVRDENSFNSSLIGKFNITELPSLYILNRNGEIVTKVASIDKLETELAKLS